MSQTPITSGGFPKNSTRCASATRGVPASYARFSSNLQDEKSNEDQHDACAAAAERHGLKIEADRRYSDRAVSGTTSVREGLSQLLQDVEQGLISVVYFFSLSRLARDSVISQTLLRKIVLRHRVRVVSVTEGIDSNLNGWIMSSGFMSIQHEQFVHQLSQFVFNGQRSSVSAGFAVADGRYGYRRIFSPNGETKIKAGIVRRRRVFAICRQQAKWVRRIFRWYAEDGKAIAAIVRELNRRKVPRDRRSVSGTWNYPAIIGILTCRKYVGEWSWGHRQNVRDGSGGTTVVRRADDDPALVVQRREHLRIVSDELFEKAAERHAADCAALDHIRDENGRINGAHKRAGRQHCFRSLLVCDNCSGFLHTYSDGGKYFRCPNGVIGVCTQRSGFRRDVAKRLILGEIGRRLVTDTGFLEDVHAGLLKLFERSAHSTPKELNQEKEALRGIEKQIQRLLNVCKSTDDPPPTLLEELRELGREKTRRTANIAKLDRHSSAPRSAPTLEFVRSELGKLLNLIESTEVAARDTLALLLNGPIRMKETQRDGERRPVWQASFRLHPKLLLQKLWDGPEAQSGEVIDSESPEIRIDLREPTILERRAAEVFRRLKDGECLRDIAVSMSIHESVMTQVVKEVERRNADGLTREQVRELINANRPKPPRKVELFVAPAMDLWDQGLLAGEIAKRLGTHGNMITQAIRIGHERRGLPVPDGRERRKSLENKGRSPWESRRREAAPAVGETPALEPNTPDSTEGTAA
jgi:site-specific DNA recombinase